MLPFILESITDARSAICSHYRSTSSWLQRAEQSSHTTRALHTGTDYKARPKQSFSERSAKNFSHQDRESQAVFPGESSQELWFLMYTVSGASPSPRMVQGHRVGRGREGRMGR